MDPFALLKRWSLGTYLRRQHIDSYLNEFVFRYNRRFYRHVSFETVLGDAPRAGSLPSSSGKTLAKLPRQSGDSHAIARQPRHRKTASGFRQDGAHTSNSADPSAGDEPGTTE
jgi:hypothetical protein